METNRRLPDLSHVREADKNAVEELFYRLGFSAIEEVTDEFGMVMHHLDRPNEHPSPIIQQIKQNGARA